MDKARNLRQHAFRRARERFDLHLSQNDHAEITRIIQSGKAAFLERQSRRVTVWDLTYKGVEVRAVYDKIRKEIVTFLYPVVH